MALDDILAAIRVVAAGDGLIAPSITRRLIKNFAAGRPAETAPTGRFPAQPIASAKSSPSSPAG